MVKGHAFKQATPPKKPKLTFQEIKKQIAFGVDAANTEPEPPQKEKTNLAQTWGFGSRVE